MKLRIAAVLALLVPAALHAQLRPYGHWRQIESNHFRVIYEQGLDSIAHHAAERAELEHARLSAGLVRPPTHKIDLIIGDNTDITNGFATPFPDNRITIYARPPVEELSLQYYDDWIDLVVTHELTHIFHMEQAGRVGKALRTVFGRLPVPWPVYPIVGLPRWNLEGLAVLIESQHTGVGRLEGSYHEMVVRTDVLEHRFQTIDRVSGETPIWPGGNRAYIYGSLFMEYIARKYGEKAHTALIGKTAGSILPPTLHLDDIARKATGNSYSHLYGEWRAELERTYAHLADSLRAAQLTVPERISREGRRALFVRVAPDNRRIAYADENGREITATRILDMRSRKGERIRRNGFGPLAWLPDGSGYITAQYELLSPYESFSDLYLVKNGTDTRITFGSRDETPDLSRDGNWLVYVQNASGSNRLMLRDMKAGVTRILAERSPDAQWILPRFSPDGKRIAVQRWTRAHGHDIAIVDLNGKLLSEIRTEGTDGAPSWSPDGRYVLFNSDRTGITNLYASDGKSIRQVTNLLGGAFYPDVSSDARWIYYSGYHADGFHIERIAYDPSAWREQLPAAPAAIARADTVQPPGAHYENVTVSTPRKYHSLRSALPTWWTPTLFGDTAFTTFIGAATAGVDDIGRHSYGIQLAADAYGRVAGNLTYSYAGLGNPVINLEATRNWDYTGHVGVRDSAGNITHMKSYEREDRVTLSTTVYHSRWRNSGALVLGAEGVELNRGILGPAHFRDPRDKLVGILAGVGYANYVMPALSITREDGVRGSVFVRRRFDIDPSSINNASYTELSGSGAAYKSLNLPGFAHHALAAHVSGLLRTGTGAGPTDVGGVQDFLPVRGYPGSARVGYKAWTAAAEYRLPIGLVGRGYKLWPVFLDRFGATAFFDAGNASCSAAQRQIYISCAGAPDRPTTPLLSTGIELNASVAVISFVPGWIRFGAAQQLSDAKRLRFYGVIGQAF